MRKFIAALMLVAFLSTSASAFLDIDPIPIENQEDWNAVISPTGGFLGLIIVQLICNRHGYNCPNFNYIKIQMSSGYPGCYTYSDGSCDIAHERGTYTIYTYGGPCHGFGSKTVVVMEASYTYVYLSIVHIDGCGC